MEYVASGERPAGCIFCDFPGGPAAEHRAKLVLRVSDATALMLNRFPYNNGHLLVVPRRHVAAPGDLTVAERAALDGALWDAVALLRDVLSPEGLNVGMNLGRCAGAGIDAHVHWHVVPRWS